MFSLILKELWSDLKRKKDSLIRCFIISMILGYIMSMTLLQLNAVIYHTKVDQPLFAETLIGEQLLFAETLIYLIIFYVIFRNLPLRISRGIYVAPAGDREKRRYLLMQLAVKLLLCFIIPSLLLYLSYGRVFISSDPVLQVIQTCLWFFTFYNINLRIGTGEKSGREIDEDGYRIVSHAEEMITVYWLCLLILEWIAFSVFLFIDTGLGSVATSIIWSCIMLINLFFALRYTRPLLDDMSSYEKIYCQKLPDETVQYDI